MLYTVDVLLIMHLAKRSEFSLCEGFPLSDGAGADNAFRRFVVCYNAAPWLLRLLRLFWGVKCVAVE
jgi:hypothetical protein